MIEFDTINSPNTRFCGRFKSAPDFVHFERVTHEFILFILLEGDMYIEVDGTRHELHKNDSLLISPYQHHKGYKEAYCDYIYIHFTHPNYKSIEMNKDELQTLKDDLFKTWDKADMFQSYTEEEAKIYFPIKHQNSDSTIATANMLFGISKSMFSSRQPYYKLLLSNYTEQLLIEIAYQYIRDKEVLKTEGIHGKALKAINIIIAFINDNFMNNLSAHDIEELSGFNYDYINKEFKKSTDFTIMSYMEMVKMQNAKRYALSTDYNFAKIGEMLGYENPYYFSKVFKRREGMTLTEFVKNHKDYNN